MDTEEREPLTSCNLQLNGRSGHGEDEVAIKDCNGHGHRGIDGDDDGYETYQHPNRFQTGKYSGYTSLCTLGRVSLHDSWEFDASNDAGGGEGGYKDDVPAGSDDNEEDTGEFVSFWRHNDDSSGSDRDADSSSCSGGSDEQTQPQHLLQAHEESDSDDDRVETTMRPIPLLYRKNQGGLGQNSINDPSSNNFGSWFQRELGVANLHFNEKDANLSRRVNWQWGFGGMRRSSLDGFDDGEDEGDANSLLGSSSSDDLGLCIPAQLSPLAYDRALPEASSRNCPRDNNIFGGNRRRGILDLPIVRPFIRGTRRGFNDDAAVDSSNEADDDDNSYNAGDMMSSRQDRAAVVQSISQGIPGTKNDALLLDPAEGDGSKQSATNPPPNLLERLFLTRFLQPPDGNGSNRRPIVQLHTFLRNEDWALATTLLQSKPELAQTWHNITRLYGGRYDGKALPIHAACALRPPPEFVEMLANLYPEGLKKKDRAFGRVPLHVACRSLADSSVIRVLCEIDPSCVDERDSLKRVPMHYHVKNSSTLGEDEDDSSIDEGSVDTADEREGGKDGIKALKILLDTSPGCVKAVDHRGWIPLHVACSCSSRKGMLRVMRLLLQAWPESVNAKTDKDSDVFACVEMAGKHHPTKEKVITLLKEAKCKLDGEGSFVVDNKSESDDETPVVADDGNEEEEACSSSLNDACGDLLDLNGNSATPGKCPTEEQQQDVDRNTAAPGFPCSEDEALVSFDANLSALGVRKG